MSNEYDVGPGQEHIEHLDADAVCEPCGTVNPEGTLLCKTCGNNLRDQRQRRIAAGGVVNLEALQEPPTPWLGRGIVTLGILLVLWVVINVSNGNIERYLVGADRDASVDLWRGAEARRYRDLREALVANPATEEDAAAAEGLPIEETDYSGRFVLFSADDDEAFIGEVETEQQDDELYFVALLGQDRDIEVRGVAVLEGEAFKVRETGSLRFDQETYLINGATLMLEDGGIKVIGRAETLDRPFSAVAYRVPD